MSAHAEVNGLQHWIDQVHHPPKKTFVSHDEEESSTTSAEFLTPQLRGAVLTPEYDGELIYPFPTVVLTLSSTAKLTLVDYTLGFELSPFQFAWLLKIDICPDAKRGC